MRRSFVVALFALVFTVTYATSTGDSRKRDSDDDDLDIDSSAPVLSAGSLARDYEKAPSLWATDAPAATSISSSKITMPTFEIETTPRVDMNNLMEEDETMSKVLLNKLKPTGDESQANKPTVSSIGIIRSLLKKEVRKLKSSITDSIMEEVINYYGKKLDMTDILARDMERVNNRLSLIEENVTLLNQNYKQLLKNHRNLVDMVRNNFISSKKEKKLSPMSSLLNSSDQPNSNVKNQASSVFATIITDLLLNNNKAKSNASKSGHLTGTDLEAMTLRNHLINDLETKYSNLVNQNLMSMMTKSPSVNSSAPAVTPLDTSAMHLQLVEEVEPEKGINFSALLPKKGKTGSNSNDTRKIVIRNEDKKQSMKGKKKSSSLRHKHANQHHLSNESVGIEEAMRSSKEQLKLRKYHRINHNTTLAPEEMPTDCQDIRNRGVYKNGVYKVFSHILNTSFEVYCEFEGNIGWTVLQHRFDGTTSFHQNWKTYKEGFGNLVGEFWLGLDYMHALTTQRNCSLQIIMTDWKNDVYRADYNHFRVDDEKSKYKLEISGYMRDSSNAGDSLAGGDDTSASNSANNHHAAALTAGNMDPIRNTPAPMGQSHQNMPFSTFDSDNDMRFYDNCAQLFKSGWWFNQCFQANLNGIYYTYKNAFQQQQIRFLRNGLHWNSIDFYKSLKSTKMRIKPVEA